MPKSRNMYFVGKNELELREEEVGQPSPGQVLIQAERQLISTGTECICLMRNFEPGSHWEQWVKYPFPPGYSFAGRVLEVGRGVENFKEGDKVTTSAPHHEFVLRPSANVVHIPERVSPEEATFHSLGVTVQIAIRRAHIELGDSVVIVGAGILGQLAIQYARACGALRTIVIDPAEKRLELARSHGATDLLPMPVQDARDAVWEMTKGHGADVVMDITGHAQVFSEALQLARDFGKVILLGDTGYPQQQHLTLDVLRRGLTVVGVHGSHAPAERSKHVRWGRVEMIETFLELLSDGRMKVADLVTHRCKPEEARAAYDLLLKKRSEALGVVFCWSG